MYILGLNYFPAHDTAACLIKDGKVLGFIEEERLNREKHTKQLPFKSIDYLLKEQGLAINDIDYVAIGTGYSFSHFTDRFFYAVKFGIFSFPNIIFDYARKYLQFKKRIKLLKNHYQYRGKIVLVDHHTSHLASVFFVSPFQEAAVISIDGAGLRCSGKFAVGRGNKLFEFDEVKLPHSIGIFYHKVTSFLGFGEYGSEGKVMGLSSYGNPEPYYERFKDVIKLEKNGKYRFNLKYLKYDPEGVLGGKFDLSNYFYQKFGSPRNPKDPLTEREENMAASLQKITEEVMFHLLGYLYEKTKIDNLCLAGGVIQNSVANGKIRENTNFKNIYITPASYDAGNAIGAAFYLYNQILGNERNFVLDTAYLGPEFPNSEIKPLLERLKLKFSYLEDPVKTAAELLSQGSILGWFQGRMEAGARALGNRSILADPRKGEMKDILNKLVKFREPFRPFAPSILAESTKEYFEQDYPVPFMEKVYNIRPEKRELIPAVTHVDGTGRLQTVEKQQNLLYWQLIKEFERITGIPIILNTSFNVKGEPIICTPRDALNCFFGTGMDYLILGNYLVSKK